MLLWCQVELKQPRSKIHQRTEQTPHEVDIDFKRRLKPLHLPRSHLKKDILARTSWLFELSQEVTHAYPIRVLVLYVIEFVESIIGIIVHILMNVQPLWLTNMREISG